MTVQPGPGPRWADLVFHVLAHVAGPPRFASSLDDPLYRAFCRRHLGPWQARPLGEDVEHLSQALTSHELLAQLQWVAFLFDDPAQARLAGARELAELLTDESAAGVNRTALRALSGVETQAELIRAAAELEAPYHARLPSSAVDEAAFSGWLERVASAAPRLDTLQVKYSRALTHHGRVVAPVIYVGVPSPELHVEMSQVAVQAAHEATVIEVMEAARSAGFLLGEREVEQVALVVFAERAKRTGLEEAHGRWWLALELPAPGELRESLADGARRALEALERQPRV